MVRGGLKDRARPATRVLDLAPPGGGTCAGSAMATLSLPARSPSHIHAPRRLQFSASSDGLLLWLRNECWGRGLFRLAGLLDDLLTEHQAEQPEPPLDPELEALLPF